MHFINVIDYYLNIKNENMLLLLNKLRYFMCVNEFTHTDIINLINVILFIFKYLLTLDMLHANIFEILYEETQYLLCFTDSQMKRFIDIVYDDNINFINNYTLYALIINEHYYYNGNMYQIINEQYSLQNTRQFIDNLNGTNIEFDETNYPIYVEKNNKLSETEFNLLTKIRLTENKNELCVMCQSLFEINDNVIVTNCMHYFHTTCLRPWLLKESATCPICRTSQK